MDDEQKGGAAGLIELALIREGIEKNDLELLVAHLRSKKPIDPLLRSYLADLFDAKKPIGIYAKVVLERGNNSKIDRDLKLYDAVEEWKNVNKKKGMPDAEWEKIAGIFKSGGISGARAAYRRARDAWDEYHDNNALED